VDLDRIRTMIREKLESGQLPPEKCLITWFGPGSGQRCVACERVIGPQEIECECEHPRGELLRFHQTCFAAWDDERQAIGVWPRPSLALPLHPRPQGELS
jgi:hypothetical protein